MPQGQYLEDHYRKPEPGDEVLLMSPTELLAALKMDPKNRSNATLFGFYLRKNNFQRGIGRERRNYQVALKM